MSEEKVLPGSQERAFFSSLLTLLSAQMGSNTEVVLYDLTGSAPKLIDIRNGQKVLPGSPWY